jgi:hypothetical protein
MNFVTMTNMSVSKATNLYLGIYKEVKQLIDEKYSNQ